MKTDLASAAKAIDAALQRIGKAEVVGPLRIDIMPSHASNEDKPGLLITPAGVSHPRLFDLPVDRSVLPPGVADEIAVQLYEDADDRHALGVMHDETYAVFEDLAAQLPVRPFLALHSSDAFPATPYSLFAPILTHTLDRRWTRTWRIGGTGAKTTADRMAAEERSRAGRVEAAGSRADALLCCPVVARMIADDPDKWRVRIRGDLDKPASGMAFRDGTYRPMAFLGGARWRESTLILKGEMPETLRSALEGRPLSDVVRHEMIPDGITITGTAQRNGDGEVYVRTDAKPVPMGPMLTSLGLVVRDPS